MKSDWQTVLARVLTQFTYDNDLAVELLRRLREDSKTYGLARGQWLAGDEVTAAMLLTMALENMGYERKGRVR